MLLLGWMLWGSQALAQADREFWFAPPEIVQNGGQNFDRPIMLRMSSQAAAATVTISLPANPTFVPITVNIPANATRSVDLTPFINILETTPPNTVLNRGLYISATERISAYYEVASGFCDCNPEIFALKGRDALGTEFYTPFQNLWNNSPGYTPTPFSSFDIVATEDNTVITITPVNHVIGHAAGNPFSITLDRGQTYSARAFSNLGILHLGGSRIESDKPVAVTIKDDLLRIQSCADVMGDQIVPVDVVGTDYIVMRGFMNPGLEHAFVLATQNNTTVTINEVAVATLNAGETYTYQVNDPATFIQTSAPAYVLHASGFGCEVGGALLPSIDCTGSTQIGFTRSTNEAMGMNLMVRAGAEDAFVLNGNPALVPAAAFAPVAGTNGEWMSAQITFTPAQVPIDVQSTLVNNEDLFHMGIINGGTVTGSRFGYFSGFNTLNLGPDQIVCRGDTVLLDGGDNKDSYLWNDGSDLQTLAVVDSGTYTLIATRQSCVLYDTVEVAFHPPTGADFPAADTTLCEGNALLLDATTPNATYAWQDNSAAATFTVTAPGTYSVQVTDEFGCEEADTIEVGYERPPELLVSNDTIICPGDMASLRVVVLNDSVPTQLLWNPTGDTLPTIAVMPELTSTYTVAATNFCGTTTSAPMQVAINAPLSITAEVQDASCANFNDGFIAVEATGGSGGFVYTWMPDSGATARLENLGAGDYALNLQDAIGCALDTSFVITEPPLLEAEVVEQTDVDCFGNETGAVLLEARGGTPDYEFSLDSTLFAATASFVDLRAGSYRVVVRDAQACTAVVPVDILEPEALLASVNHEDASCFGFSDGRATAQIEGGTPPYEPLWIDHPEGPQTGEAVENLPVGTYQLMVVDANGCEEEVSLAIGQPDKVQLFVTENEAAYCAEPNGYATVQATGGSGQGFTYEWQTQPVQSTPQALNLSGGMYQVLGRDDTGCADTLLVEVQEIPPAVASFATDPLTEEPILESRARLQMVNFSEHAITYQWDMGDGTTFSDVEAPFHEYQEPGIYTIVMTAFDSTFNCPVTDSITFEIIPDGTIYVPSAFTPNSDGINDEFRLFGEGVVSMQCMIFDRWGREVARLTDLIGSWNGLDKGGQPVPEGVYVYVLRAEYNSGAYTEKGGTITVIR